MLADYGGVSPIGAWVHETSVAYIPLDGQRFSRMYFNEPFTVVLEELELAVFGSDSMCPVSSFVLMRSNATSRLTTWSSKKWLHTHQQVKDCDNLILLSV